MLKVKRVGAAIPAQDMDRARQFYEQKLGFKPSTVDAEGVSNMFGETGFLLFRSMGKPSGEHTQIAFDVDDVGEAVREIKSQGIKLEEYDFPGFKTHDGIAELPGGTKGAWFKDTEGNLIGLGTLVPAAARS